MTTEFVLLLGLFAFILGGAFLGENGPRNTFRNAGPRLGARVEQHITFGHQFNFRDGNAVQWAKPDGAPPLGSP